MPPPQEPPNASKGLGGRFYSLGMAPVGGGGVTGRSSTQECLRERDRNSLLSSRQFLSPTGARNSRELLAAPQLPVHS